MSIIQAAGSGEVSTGFYKLLLDQSLKFDDGGAQYLTRTNSGAASSTTVTVLSCWVKRCTLGSIQMIFTAATTAPNVCGGVYFTASDQIAVYLDKTAAGSDELTTITTSVFRDVSAWYHVVIVYNTADSTTANKSKIYVNGVQQPVTTSTTGSAVTTQRLLADGVVLTIGKYFNDSYYLDGYLAEYHVVDGVAGIDHDDFGETKDGIWVAKSYSGGHGNNGFHLTFKDDVVSEGFNTVTYTGTGAVQSISGIGFQPDFVWLKGRTVDGESHYLFDSVRGAGKAVFSESTAAENDYGTGSTSPNISFDGDGFSLGDSGTGTSGRKYVGWCWEAGGAPTANNSAGVGATPTAGSVKIDGSNLGSALGGSIAATRISANTARGFSITTYTGTGGTKTVAHGLGATPAWVMVKVLVGAPTYWRVWHTGVTSGENLLLNDAGADSAYTNRIGTNHTSSVVELIESGGATDNVNANGGSYVMYSWTDISGYSKFGSYSGNGSTTGPTVTTGFLPAWVLIKGISGASHWQIWDTTRHPSNPNDNRLFPNLSDAEDGSGSYAIEITSTGFQIKHNGSDINTSGHTYIYAAFADTRSAAFFKDVTTNGNHFTPVNLDYRDSVPDVPTNNFATLNGLDNDSMTLSNGNLTGISPANAHNAVGCTFGVTGGKWYWEVRTGTGSQMFFGMAKSTFQFISQYTNDAYNFSDIWAIATDGQKSNGSGESSYGSSFSSGDILQLAFDLDNGKFYAGKNGTYFSSGDPAGGTNAAFTNVPTNESMQPFYGSSTSGISHTFNFGQDSSFDGLKATSNANADANGHGSFAYAPPSGFLALCSQNLPDAAIIDGSDNFNTVLYTGNQSTRSITGVGFSPDFLWIKGRNTDQHHNLYDALRSDSDGPRRLYSSLAAAEESTVYSGTTNVSSLDADGFTMGNGTSVNENSKTFVAWNWLAGTAFSNSSGSNGANVDSSGQVNTTAGFSIVSWQYTTSADNLIVHGLSSAPEMMIVKSRTTAYNWDVYHPALSAASKRFILNGTLNSTGAGAEVAGFFDTAPTATLFEYNTSAATNNDNMIAYCFHSVEGYSKIGTYSANNSADGTFVYTGFRPAWVMIKKYNAAGQWWGIYDSVRDPDNLVTQRLWANAQNVESAYSTDELDFLSNGFKPRGNYDSINGSGSSYLYLAFAEQPFKFANAR